MESGGEAVVLVCFTVYGERHKGAAWSLKVDFATFSSVVRCSSLDSVGLVVVPLVG